MPKAEEQDEGNNVVYFCQDCQPKPELYSGDLKLLIGKYIKTFFTNEEDKIREHMWVKVISADQSTVTGVLWNIPRHIPWLHLGDKVTVAREDIERWK